MNITETYLTEQGFAKADGIQLYVKNYPEKQLSLIKVKDKYFPAIIEPPALSNVNTSVVHLNYITNIHELDFLILLIK